MATAKRVKESYCIGCGRLLPMGDFYFTINPLHANKVLPYCRSCCKMICDMRLSQTKSLESAIWLSCAEMGVPFIKAVYEMVGKRLEELKTSGVSGKGDVNYFGIYMSALYTKSQESTDVWTDFRHTDVPLGEIQVLRTAEEIINKEKDNLRLIWGDKTVDDLQYLEYRYTMYTEGKKLTEYQAGLYRDLCLAELDIYHNNDIDAATKRKQTIGKALGIDQFNVEKEKSEVEKMLEYQIAVMEEEEPAEFYKDINIYGDHCKIGEYWKQNIMRPLVNLLTGSKDYGIEAELFEAGDKNGGN